ncbi:MAG TPA: GGDEF domain-containing protein [Nitriliruptorales bacterium]
MTDLSGQPSPVPGLVARLLVAALVLMVPMVALGVGLAIALSAATPAVRGGLVAAMVTWGVACATSVGVVVAFGWAVVTPARRLARAAADLAAGGDADGLPLERRDEFGTAARAVASLGRDRERLRGELRDAALRDPETGFYDARELRRRLDQEEARARRHDHPFALVVIDVDAQDGDIAGVAAALLAAVRPTDIVARLGVSAFASLLPETSGEGAARVVDRLRSGLGEGLAAVGVAVHPEAGATGEQILRAAIAALDGSRTQDGAPVVYGR